MMGIAVARRKSEAATTGMLSRAARRQRPSAGDRTSQTSPEHGERRGDSREQVEDDELRENPADEKPVTLSASSRKGISSTSNARTAYRRAGATKPRASPYPRARPKSSRRRGFPFRSAKPARATPSPATRDRRSQDATRKTACAIRFGRRSANGAAKDRLGGARKERVEQMVVRPLGTIERQGRERTRVHPVVPRESFVTGERLRAPHGSPCRREKPRRAPPR